MDIRSRFFFLFSLLVGKGLNKELMLNKILVGKELNKELMLKNVEWMKELRECVERV